MDYYLSGASGAGAVDPVTAPLAPAAVGRWGGETVTVLPASDPLGDAKEEISYAHAEHTEQVEHGLHERHVRQRRPLPLPQVGAIEHYLDAAAKPQLRQAYREFVRTIRAQARHGASGQVQRHLQQQFSQPTEQWLALAYAAQELAALDADPRLLAEVQACAELLDSEHAARLRADLHSIDAAAAFGQGDPIATARLQDAYHDAVQDQSSLNGMLAATLQRFGSKDYRAAVSSLITALGKDLGAVQGSSAEPLRLRLVLQELYLLEALAASLDSCDALARRLQRQHALALEPGALLQDLVQASSERWVDAGRFQQIALRHGARALAPRIAVLHASQQLVSQLPPKVFTDADAREHIISAARLALDAPAEEEDA